jgi:hypothetical protein
MSALAGYDGPWVVIPGNHDAALAEGVWVRAMRAGLAPANLRLVTTPGIVDFPEAGFSVLAAPLTQRQTHDDLTGWFDGAATLPGRLRIGLAHGSVQGILHDEVDSPNPIAPGTAAPPNRTGSRPTSQDMPFWWSCSIRVPSRQ